MVDPPSDQATQILQFTGLKQLNPALKVLISVGGWAFNDPGPTRSEFHNIISTAGQSTLPHQNRNSVIVIVQVQEKSSSTQCRTI